MNYTQNAGVQQTAIAVSYGGNATAINNVTIIEVINVYGHPPFGFGFGFHGDHVGRGHYDH